MKKIVILPVALLTLFINLNVTYAAELANIRSNRAVDGKGSTIHTDLNYSGGTLDVSSVTDIVGIRISLVDMYGKRIPNTSVINLYKDKGLYSGKTFYNSLGGNRADVLKNNSLTWKECPSADCINWKTKSNGFGFANNDIVKITDATKNEDYFANVRAFIVTLSDKIRAEGSSLTHATAIFEKFGSDKDTLIMYANEAKNKGAYLLIEPINTFMLGTEYAATDKDKDMYKLVRGFLKDDGSWDTSKTIDNYYVMLKTGSTLKGDFVASLNDMTFNVSTSQGLLTFNGCRYVAYQATGGTTGYEELANLCNAGNFVALEGSTNGKIIVDRLKNEAVSPYVNSIKEYYNDHKAVMIAFKQKYGTSDASGDPLGDEARFYFVGTPSEFYMFNEAQVWKNSSTIKSILESYCTSSKYLKNVGCSNYTSKIRKLENNGSTSFKYLMFDGQIDNLIYLACGGSYSSSGHGCGVIGLSILGNLPDVNNDACDDNEYAELDKLAINTKLTKAEIDYKLDNTNTDVAKTKDKNGKITEYQNLRYCCDGTKFDVNWQSKNTSVLTRFIEGGDIYNVCHAKNNACTYEDYQEILKLDDWGSDETVPANGIKDKPTKSGYVSPDPSKTGLYACCTLVDDASNYIYDEDAQAKFKTEFGVTKKTNLSKKFNEKVRLKCQGSNANTGCGKKEIEDISKFNTGLFSPTSKAYFDTSKTLQYCCDVYDFTNKKLNEGLFNERFDVLNYNQPGKITEVQKAEIATILFENCPVVDTCSWSSTLEVGERYTSSGLDCCDYKNIDKSTLPKRVNTESKFKKSAEYKEICAARCELKNNDTFVLSETAIAQGKTEDWCCFNDEGQWDDAPEIFNTSVLHNTALRTKYKCVDASICEWDPNRTSTNRIETKYGKSCDCCDTNCYDQEDLIDGLVDTLRIRRSLVKNNLNSVFKSTDFYRKVCVDVNNYCSYDKIPSDKSCCTSYDSYSEKDKATINTYYGLNSTEKLMRFIKDRDQATGNHYYKDYCSSPCEVTTVIDCPNCDKIANSSSVLGTSISSTDTTLEASSGNYVIGKSYDVLGTEYDGIDATILELEDDQKQCIVANDKFLVTEEKRQGEQVSQENIGNKYCKVYCTEKIIYEYPKGLTSVEAGRKYSIGSAFITTVKTCRIDGVNTEEFLNDINKQAQVLREAYDDYLKYKEVVDDSSGKIKVTTSDTDTTCACENSRTVSGVKFDCCTDTYSTTSTETYTDSDCSGKVIDNPSWYYPDCSASSMVSTGISILTGGTANDDSCEPELRHNYSCEDSSYSYNSGSGKCCKSVQKERCKSPGSEYKLTNSSSCTYTKCSVTNNARWDYETIPQYTYGTKSNKTNSESTKKCRVGDNSKQIYLTSYKATEASKWIYVTSMQSVYNKMIDDFKHCFDLGDEIKATPDYDFQIDLKYNQPADNPVYSHEDTLNKTQLEPTHIYEDLNMQNRVNIKSKITARLKDSGKIVTTKDEFKIENLEDIMAYRGDLINTIYSIKMERQYKYTLTTGYKYILKGKPQSVKEKQNELQEIEVEPHLPVSYDYTDDGEVRLLTRLDNSSSKKRRTDLALCTVAENSDYEYVCKFDVFDRLILSPGILPVYRPIILSNPFPDKDGNGRNTGVNWCQDSTNCSNNPNINNVVKTYITKNRDVTEDNVYNLTPLYTIDLTPMDIQRIREYNKSTTYNDFRLVCDPDTGRNCQSIFLRGSSVTGYDPTQEPYMSPSNVISDITSTINFNKSCALVNGSGMKCRTDGRDLFAGGIN